MNTLFVNTDGGSRGNPGPMAIGAVIKSESGQILKKISARIGEGTNNVAEYNAVIEALLWLKTNDKILTENNISKINFLLDSTLVVNQLNGLFKIKDGNMKMLNLKIKILEAEIKKTITYAYIPREKNQEADFLVNQAFDSSL